MDTESLEQQIMAATHWTALDLQKAVDKEIAELSGLIDAAGALDILARRHNIISEKVDDPIMSTPPQDAAPHYTFADVKALEQAVFKQDYSCVITKVSPPSTVTIRATGEVKDIQEFWLSDGTEGMKYTLWSKASNLKEGMGVELTGAYIKKSDKGYYTLKIASPVKGGSIRFTPTTTVVPHVYDPTAAPSKPQPTGGIPAADKKVMEKFFLALWTQIPDATKTTLMASDPELATGMNLVNQWIMGDD